MNERAMAVVDSGNAWGVWGQDHAVSELISSYPDGIRHGYVLSGPAMSGKKTLALAFAQALMCPEPVSLGIPCRSCPTCSRVARGIHQDLSIFDLEWQDQQTNADKRTQALNIDSVRAVSRSVSLRPVESRWRVVIVDDVETMQETAQEAFLKTLEEPPPYTVLLLLTDDIGSLLPTILSRAVSIRVGPTSTAIVAAALGSISIDEQMASEIATVSEGLVGWAIRASGDAGERDLRIQDYAATVSWISAGAHDRMVTAFGLADTFAADRERMYRRLTLAMLGWRTVLRQGLGMAADGGTMPGLRSSMPNTDGCARAIGAIRQCMHDLEHNVRPRLALQSMLQSWPDLNRN